MPRKRMVKIGEKYGISSDKKVIFSKCDLHSQTRSGDHTSRETNLLFQFESKKPEHGVLCNTVGWSREFTQQIQQGNVNIEVLFEIILVGSQFSYL